LEQDKLTPGCHIAAKMSREKKPVQMFQHHAIYLGKGHEFQQIVRDLRIDITLVMFGDVCAADFARAHVNDGIIIENNGSGIVLNTLDMFIATHEHPKLLRYTHDGAHTVCRRALGFQKKDTFDLYTDNCEHFATYCMTGTVISFQINTLRDGVLMIGSFIVVIVGIILSKKKSS